jgi:hypothetical protein
MSAAIDNRARHHFYAMTREQVADAVRDMKAMGFSDYAVAAATRLAVEEVRRILGERKPESAP